MKYNNIREEELKNKVAHDYFWTYDCSKIIGNVDFCVCLYQSSAELFEQESLLWAEAKKGSSDIYKSIVQLILTIGKARTFDKFLPPPMLGAFDGEKIAFIPYNEVHDIFYQNDFNWNITPSDHDTKEFKLVYEKVKSTIDEKTLLFHYDKDDRELNKFIKNNFVVGKYGLTKIKIDKNNFMVVYNKWLQAVKPTIALKWDILKIKNNIIDGDFYLADLLSKDNLSLKDKLFVYLTKDHYELERTVDDLGMFRMTQAFFTDKQVAHTQFWNKYERPPKEEYWDYIVERRDLLVPQDVRERKGSFFTPQKWVELSQKYLTDVLGEDWQDEYYVWDCAAGTGNLLTGLTNKYNIWASTLDKQDVEVMHDRIKNGANLLDDHVFQFDFLNDDFNKLPEPLQNIINNPEKRKKLVIYINPPYAEASSTIQKIGTGENKTAVAESKIYDTYQRIIGMAARELFAQFLFRIYKEIPNSIIGQFSTLKALNAQNFEKYRLHFQAKLEQLFVVPADTFDNVKGQFPIGFFIWDTRKKESFKKINFDVYNSKADFIGTKIIQRIKKNGFIINWLREYYDKVNKNIAYLRMQGTDMQNNSGVFVTNSPSENDFKKKLLTNITPQNIIPMCIYFAVRHVIPATWLNDRDQFLYPNDGWKTDKEFQSDCLAYTLFNNNIQSNAGTNHWIPFTEREVNSREKFESNFMTEFIKGKPKALSKYNINLSLLFEPEVQYKSEPLKFSQEANSVFDAGRELWKYYHAQPNCNVNASLYDIKEYFQGRNYKGRMNNKSDNETYNLLISNLRDAITVLAKKIEPKVYEYGFLK